jgi:23S rRNA (adenine2503-C2)-methyltransferase
MPPARHEKRRIKNVRVVRFSLITARMISLNDTAGLDALRSQNAVQPHRMKQFLNALFKKALSPADALATLPERARPIFERQIDFQPLELIERHDSSIDAASKLIFRTRDGHLIESVILQPKTGRTSLCISSQVGCACACDFCATGQMGFTRNLTAAEIIDQVMQANRLVQPEGRSIRNVVFMGMGEPLLNADNVFAALERLRAPAYFNYSGSRLMVSTVGIPEAMRRFVKQFPDVQLALSLHSARQEVRERLMPQARSCPLEALRRVLVELSGERKVMIEYLMLAGVNDGEADLLALIDYLQGLSAHINLIPFNAFDGCDLLGTAEPELQTFAARLKDAGFQTTMRYSLGNDIAAACGQLVQRKRG